MLFAGTILLVALSCEILTGDNRHFSATYLWIQFGVCIVFLGDFFLRWSRSSRKGVFLLHNWLFLLLSISYFGFCVTLSN